MLIQTVVSLPQAMPTRNVVRTSTRQASLRTARPHIGRALAMLGIGIDTSIASANEVEDAIAQQQAMVDNPKVQKQEALDAPVENIMDKAVATSRVRQTSAKLSTP